MNQSQPSNSVYGNAADDAKKKREYSIFTRSVLTAKVLLKITEVGKTLKQNLERKIVNKTEGRCIAQGYIRPNSVKVATYSSGNVNGEYIEYQVVYECLVCHPMEGMRMKCKVKTTTLAGIHAEVEVDEVVPLTIFVARDHNYKNKTFSSIQPGNTMEVKIIGIRFELNDPFICAIAALVDSGSETRKDTFQVSKPRLNLGNDGDDEMELGENAAPIDLEEENIE